MDAFQMTHQKLNTYLLRNYKHRFKIDTYQKR